LGVQAMQTEAASESFEMDQRRRALAERHRAIADDGHQLAKAPEPARSIGVRELAGQTRQVERDGEVDGDAGLTAARAARETQAGRERVATSQTLEPEHARRADRAHAPVPPGAAYRTWISLIAEVSAPGLDISPTTVSGTSAGRGISSGTQRPPLRP